MKFPRVALLLVFLVAPLAGCGSHADAPRMVGKEALEALPKDTDYKPSAKAKKVKAEGSASSFKAQ